MSECAIEEQPEAEHRVRVHRVGDDQYSSLWPWRADCTCGAGVAGPSHQAVFDLGFAHARHASAGPIDLLPLAKNRLAWDLLDHANIREGFLRLGLSPAPPDIEALEHREAHARAEKLGPVANLAETYCAIIAEINAEFLSWQREEESGGTDTVPDEAREYFTQVTFRMIRGAVLAVLAEFLADGVVAYGPAVLQTLMAQP